MKQIYQFDYSNLTFVGLPKKYTFDFKSFMSLGSLAENIYNGKVSLNTTKQKQRKIENILNNFIGYNPVKVHN